MQCNAMKKRWLIDILTMLVTKKCWYMYVHGCFVTIAAVQIYERYYPLILVAGSIFICKIDYGTYFTCFCESSLYIISN